jgi:excisionase family DNA binding protein
MATLITAGVGYAQFFDDLRAVIRHELAQNSPSAKEPDAQVGGIELAQEITGLSKPRIYALVSERKICHAKRGNKLYFNRADLLAWVAEGNRAVHKQNER